MLAAAVVVRVLVTSELVLLVEETAEQETPTDLTQHLTQVLAVVVAVQLAQAVEQSAVTAVQV